MGSRRNLEEFLKESGVDFKLIEVSEAATSEEAASSLGISLCNIAKTIVLKSDSGRYVLVVVAGDRRVDLDKLAKTLGFRKLRLANAEEVEEVTGYPPGGVPPICHSKQLPTYVDLEVFQLDLVYTGGGDDRHLLCISPKSIVDLARAKVIDVPKR